MPVSTVNEYFFEIQAYSRLFFKVLEKQHLLSNILKFNNNKSEKKNPSFFSIACNQS